MDPRGPVVPGDDPDEVLAARARDLAAPPEAPRPTDLHLVLRVGPHRFGVPVARARHVSGAHRLTRVPGAPDAILGTAAVLGSLVAVADLGGLLGVAPERAAADRELLVIGEGDEAVGVLVDEVSGLAEVDVDVMSPRDDTVELAGPTTEGLRLLHVDALVADPRLWPPDHSSNPSAGGQL